MSAPNDQLVLAEALFKAYYRKTCRAITYLIKDPYSVEDVVQQAFLKAFNRLNQLNDFGKFGPWLVSIAINEAKDVLRREKKVLVLDNAEQLGSLKRAEYGGKGILEEIELKSDVNSYLQQLPLKYREVLLLKYYYDLEIKEIAQFLKISQGTVKSRIHRAKEAYRQLVEAWENSVASTDDVVGERGETGCGK
ncbi:RNA polymerase sigma factor [Zhaonella formicivorans]|uniref:RNA polymerase sigma factor n=1 Tax=Zhaonella formicivorans TaxID=2528593 RepID=UPI0010D1326F|nr:RNA polymerase sigma factor [Zhaonella formicivorans]